MALLIIIAYLVLLLILISRFKKKNNTRDIGVVLVVFGVLLPVLMFLFIPQSAKTPILNKELYLYEGTNIFTNDYTFNKVSYKIPVGFGVFMIAIGALMLIIGKNSDHEKINDA